MSTIVLLLWGLLALKLCWNVVVPVAVRRRASSGDQAGISLAPFVEFLLLVLLVGASAFSSGEPWWCHWPTVLGMGLGAIVGSYALMVAVGFLAERMMRR